MPLGVSLSKYLKFMTCSLLSMFAGSQLVHWYYNPLKDIDEYVEKEKQKYKK